MFWADRIAQDIIASGKHKPYWVDDMKTPSGRIHVGSLRGVVIHDLVHKALRHAGQDVTFSYVFEDHDPMDGLPIYLDEKVWSKYLGQPLFTIPSPEGRAKSYAEYFALEFKSVFNKIGSTPKIIWVSELYKTGKMNPSIKLCLDKVETIRQIYQEMYKKKLPNDWYPFQVLCPQCSKESTTRVTAWDGKEVTFTCKVDAVDWTKGCGYTEKTSPFSGDGKYVGKLPWKVEWGVKWKTIGVTVEGGGKDHMSAGGSYDIAKQICEKVLNYSAPYPVAHEFFLIGGKKMSSSKGLGTSAIEVSKVFPPYLLRFLFTRTDYQQAINFDPVGSMVIPDLFDEYDRCWQAYNQNSDADLASAFEYGQVDKLPARNPALFLPRFRDIMNYVQQPGVILIEEFVKVKGVALSDEEQKILKERMSYAKIWLDKFAPEEYRLEMSKILPYEIESLSPEQKTYLSHVVQLFKQMNNNNADELQIQLYQKAKELQLDSKKAFAAIYTAFLGKNHGPRAGAFLLQYPKEKVVERLQEAIGMNHKSDNLSVILASKTRPGSVPGSDSGQARMTNVSHNQSNLFMLDHDVKMKYPTISVGIAIIKNVTIAKTLPELEKEKNSLLESFTGLTTEQLGKYPEILSYRKLYKEMGVDWHSRRPSPEALLRRVALNKGLYTVNTCVDAYNLVVMKNRVSVGAFDLDKVKFPTVLRYAGRGDEILLLGDAEPTKYSAKELAYYDQAGGYNIDFNYRDAQRTMVTENTQNLWINVDGVHDVTPQEVEKSLREAVEKIIRYCGGKIKLQGIVK